MCVCAQAVTGSPSRTNPHDHDLKKTKQKKTFRLLTLMIKFNQALKNIWMRFSWAELSNGIQMSDAGTGGGGRGAKKKNLKRK